VADYYLFIASGIDWSPYTKGPEIVKALADRGIWLASRFTPFKERYQEGDRVLLYAAGAGARIIMGDAVIAGGIAPASREEIAAAEKLGLKGFTQRIPLREVRLWPTPVSMKELVPRLGFVKDKKNWGLGLRQAAARIPAEDFRLILAEGGPDV